MCFALLIARKTLHCEAELFCCCLEVPFSNKERTRTIESEVTYPSRRNLAYKSDINVKLKYSQVQLMKL